MGGDKKGWTADRVRGHLQNAIYLEMWTIPLYLTTAYSIKAPIDQKTLRPEFAPVPTNPDGSPDFDRFDQTDYNQYAFNNILSVGIQEMLHLELAANLLNAVRPTADSAPVTVTGNQAPSYAAPPPCLNTAPPPGVTLRLGPLDTNQTLLFQWIEHEDANPPADPEAYSETYKSIGDLYTALSYGIAVCWPELYPPQGLGPAPTPNDLRQKDDWGSTVRSLRSGFLKNFLFGPQPGTTATDVLEAADKYPFSIMIYGAPADALLRAEAAMTAIKVQGEGAGEGGAVPPRFVPSDGDPIEIALDRISHWQRFTDLLPLVEKGKIEVYKEPLTPALKDLQKALDESHSSFLVSLDASFASQGPVGLEAMRGLGNRTLQVWQNGGTPEYKWSDPSSAIDPQRTRDLHACQGLNMCAGKGANNTGTGPGDGDCATAWFHTCSQTNTCAGQGGCGYSGGDPKGDWQPNYNSGRGNGGCGAPIPYGQIFSDDAPDNLKGNCVWIYARQLMRERVPGFPPDDPEPNEMRKLLTPTSAGTKQPPDKC